MGKGEVLHRSLLEPFKVGIVMIEGFEERIAGHVSYDRRQNITLDLVTALETAKPKASMPRNVKRAIGVLETGEYATLENMVSFRENTLNKPGRLVAKSSYVVSGLSVGESVFCAEKFDGIVVNFQGLLQWMDQRPFKKSFGTALDKVTVEYTNPHIPALTLDDGSALEIRFLYSVESNLVPVDNFTMPQSTAVCIRARTPASFSSLYRKALQFNRMVMLFAGALMPLTSLQVHAGGELFGVFGRYRSYDAGRTNYHRFNSRYTDMRDDFGGMVNEWFKFYAKHEASLDLYFDTWSQASNMSLDVEFMRVVRSLEAFHKENNRGDMHLRKRLEDMLEIPYKVPEAGTTKKEFARYVTEVRNRYAHGDIRDLENPRQYAKNLVKSIARLGVLMHGNVLHEMSIPDRVKDGIMASKIRQLDEFVALNTAE